MPKMNRRAMLRMIGAASLAPFLPALPARAAMHSAPAASASKMLWAGIYAKSGSGARFARVAQGMGLPQASVRGVAARSIGVRLAASALRPSLARAMPTTQGGTPLDGAIDALRKRNLEEETVPETTPVQTETEEHTTQTMAQTAQTKPT